MEGQPSGTLITTVFAKDFDSGNNSVVLYSIASGKNLKCYSLKRYIEIVRVLEVPCIHAGFYVYFVSVRINVPV